MMKMRMRTTIKRRPLAFLAGTKPYLYTPLVGEAHSHAGQLIPLFPLLPFRKPFTRIS